MLDNGIIIKVPRYRKTGLFIGDKKAAIRNGLKAVGRNNFYKLENGQVVIDGYIAEESDARELILTGKIVLNSNNLDEFQSILLQIAKGEVSINS